MSGKTESAQFEPELGQMIFGNASSEFDLGPHERYVTEELYELSRLLAERDQEAQVHGLLGGEFGYGQDFVNETFEMHPYYWGECECGFEAVAREWDDANPHSGSCWSERYHTERECVYATDQDYDEQVKAMDAWATANGWDGRPGVAVFCDCGQEERWQEWLAGHEHESTCRVVLPNFRVGDFEIRWYKYIGRGMSASRAISRAELLTLFSRCRESLR